MRCILAPILVLPFMPHIFSIAIKTPYCFKLLSQELMAMSLKPTIYTHDQYMEEGEDENYEDAEVDIDDEYDERS